MGGGGAGGCVHLPLHSLEPLGGLTGVAPRTLKLRLQRLDLPAKLLLHRGDADPLRLFAAHVPVPQAHRVLLDTHGFLLDAHHVLVHTHRVLLDAHSVLLGEGIIHLCLLCGLESVIVTGDMIAFSVLLAPLAGLFCLQLLQLLSEGLAGGVGVDGSHHECREKVVVHTKRPLGLLESGLEQVTLRSVRCLGLVEYLPKLLRLLVHPAAALLLHLPLSHLELGPTLSSRVMTLNELAVAEREARRDIQVAPRLTLSPGGGTAIAAAAAAARGGSSGVGGCEGLVRLPGAGADVLDGDLPRIGREGRGGCTPGPLRLAKSEGCDSCDQIAARRAPCAACRGRAGAPGRRREDAEAVVGGGRAGVVLRKEGEGGPSGGGTSGPERTVRRVCEDRDGADHGNGGAEQHA
mmetsp:Transcript_38025/g.74302  ORF Transcript_38025/g.74302 Transcript_38025/m.74302 type:complete len:406 (+) Transcript_38025:196-1413(+)